MNMRFRLAAPVAAALVGQLAVAVPAGAHAAAPAAESPDTPAAAPADGEVDADKIRMAVRIEESIRHFNEGQALASEERYLEAAAEFERSFVAIESGITLRFLAVTYERGGRAVKALETARKYLALPDCDGPEKIDHPCAKRRGDVTALARRVRAQVGELTLDVPRGVALREIRIDGKPVPLESFPLVLEPASYEIDMFGMEPGQQRTRVVELDPGETEPLYVAPFTVDRPRDDGRGTTTAPQPDPEAIAREQERRRRRKRALKISFWTSLGATAAAGATVAVFGTLTRRRFNQYDAELCDTMGTTECMEDGYDSKGFPLDRREDVDRYRPVTNAMIGVTIGLGVTTGVLAIFAFSKDPEGRRSKRWGVSPGGVVVRW